MPRTALLAWLRRANCSAQESGLNEERWLIKRRRLHPCNYIVRSRKISLLFKFTAENPGPAQLFFFLAKTVKNSELITRSADIMKGRRQNKRSRLSSTEKRGRRALKVGSWKTNKHCDLILRGSRRNVLEICDVCGGLKLLIKGQNLPKIKRIGKHQFKYYANDF